MITEVILPRFIEPGLSDNGVSRSRAHFSEPEHTGITTFKLLCTNPLE